MESQETVTSMQGISTRAIGIKYGLISTLISIVFFLALVLSGQNAFDNKWSWFGLVFSIVLVVLAHKNFKDAGNGFMSYGQGVVISFWIALISLLIGGLFTYCYVTFVDPDAMITFYEKQAQQMEEKGMPQEQIDMAITWTKTLFWPMYIFFGLFFGVLVGLIVSIFTQKKNPEPAF
jgi:hypothetical protein